MTTKKQKTELQASLQVLATKVAEINDERVKTKKSISSLELVESVVESLYAELDKLSKKSPSHPLSNLALSQVNQAIKDSKELLEGDPYVDRITEFVAAGDNPEHRDGVLILGQIISGISRGKPRLKGRGETLFKLSNEADALEELISTFVNGDEENNTEWHALFRINSRWFEGDTFSFENLDDRITERFTVE